VADLALARRRFPGDPLVARLETLVVDGRAAIYSGRARRGSPARFLVHDYWRLIAEHSGMLLLAVVAVTASTLAAAAWAIHDPGAALGLVPERFRGAASPHVRHIPLGAVTQAALASSIFTNNIQVAFLTFAGGLTLGIATLAVLAYNGVLLGTLAGLTLHAGSFSVFVRYVVPHGLLELSCFSVAGAAGLRLAWAVIEPGVLPRAVALRAAARQAVLIALGTAPWLVVAGLTEGFVTPRGLSLAAALVVGVALGGAFWTALVTEGGRAARRGRGRAGHTRARAFARR
jgi:uncharacterized membrane protein SpoIIM required for sporulation